MYELFTTLCTIVLFGVVAWRIARPFHCSCGYTTLFARAMMKHLGTRHGYVEKID